MKPTLIDPFEQPETLTVAEGEPRYALAGDGNCHVWDGRKYLRVTYILNHIASPSLYGYYAKVAALRAAAPLVHAGLVTPSRPEVEDRSPAPEFDAFEEPDADPSGILGELERFVDSEPIRNLDPAQAIREAADYLSNMKEPERYRDHKGRIGSVAHWAKHEMAMGLRTARPDLEYVLGLIHRRMVWPDGFLDRKAEYGTSPEDVALDLAYHALPHAQNVWEFMELVRPEYEMAGLEALVIHRDEEYAGNLDDWAVYRRDRWCEAFGGKWPFDPRLSHARVLADLKTSNHLGRWVRLQLAAYARAQFVGLISDHTEHPVPEFDGMVALHSVPGKGLNVTAYGRHTIDPFHETFCHLVAFVRGLAGLPKASAGRKPPALKKGERPNPIAVGGAV